MSLEDFRAEYQAKPLSERLLTNVKYGEWRHRLDFRDEKKVPSSFHSVIRRSPGPPEHYDAVLSAFLADLATQRLLGEKP